MLRDLADQRRVGSFEEQDLKDKMLRSRELSINFFDTAQAYILGASEKVLA
jgi:aryl-alcohol dehydrogenase-like predicted oxidoreductase